MLIVPGVSLTIADTDEQAREKGRRALAGKDFHGTLKELGPPRRAGS